MDSESKLEYIHLTMQMTSQMSQKGQGYYILVREESIKEI